MPRPTLAPTTALAVAALFACLIAAHGGAPARAAEAEARASEPAGPRIDRSAGEQEQIDRRREWFLERRRAGATDAADRAAKRLAAVRATRVAIERQRARRSAGDARGQNQWVAMGPAPSRFGGWTFGNVSGRVTSFAADWAGGTLYVGTASGGLWSSTNDGLSWTQLLDQAGTMTVGTVAVDPADPQTLWVGTGENVVGCESYFGIGLLRSEDGGQTWETRNGAGTTSLDALASFADVVVDPRDSDRLVVGGRVRNCSVTGPQAGGVFVTDDAGLTWDERLVGRQVYEIAQDPTVLDIWWVATDDGIWRSTDNAASFQKVTAPGLPSSNTGRTELAIAPGDGQTVYALFSNPLALYRTTDGGANWEQRAGGSNACDGQCGYNMVLRVSPFDANTVYRGTIRVFRSTNGGQSWTDLSNGWSPSQTVHQDTHALLVHPTIPGTWFVGSDGGVWKTENDGGSFLNRNGNLNVTQFYAIDVKAEDPDTICGGAQDNSSLARTSSEVWDLQAVTGDGFVCAFDASDPDVAYITSYPNVYPQVWRSDSGPFGSFSNVTGSGSGIDPNDRENWVTPYVLDPVTPSTLYLGTHRVYRSDDRGESWGPPSPDLTGGAGSLTALDVNRAYPDVVWSGSQTGRVWRSDDGGGSWADLSAGLPGRSITDVGADPGNAERGFATVGGFGTAHLWEWTPATGWVARGAGLPDVPANTVLVLAPDDVLVGTDVGVFRSFDGGVSFEPFMDGLPQGLVVTDLKYSQLQNRVTAGTYGRGAWQIEIGAVRPILGFHSIELPPVEVDGDGDAMIEPGESWAFRPRLRNAGGQTATAVAARFVGTVPGVAVLQQGPAAWPDVAPGAVAGPVEPFVVTIDPSVACGTVSAFDLLDIVSEAPQIDHGDKTAALTLEVSGGNPPGPVETALADDFDPAPDATWTSEGENPGVAPCAGFPYVDTWTTASRDAEHGLSFHAGNGPGAMYPSRAFSWLLPGGRDSTGGPGLDIPADAVTARLTISHWYDTKPGIDGAQVVIDGVDDGQDVYETLEPAAGFPAGTLAEAVCNGLEGMEAFHGSSGGWRTDTFDLLPYRGQRVHLAFVFSSGRGAPAGEGWYVDDVLVEIQQPGPAACDVSSWPAAVPPTARFELLDGAGTIEASWDAAPVCGAGGAGGGDAAAYAIHAGDLDALVASGGVFAHAPVADACDRTSPSTFAAGAGNEYYLVVPVEGGGLRQGAGGVASDGSPRATADGVCGVTREGTCPAE